MVLGRVSALWWLLPIGGGSVVFALVGAALAAAGQGLGYIFMSIALVELAVLVAIWRRRSARHARQDRIVGTGRRAHVHVLSVEPAGGQIRTNGRVTQMKVDVALEEDLVVRGVWMAPGAIEVGQHLQVAYDESTREAVLFAGEPPPREFAPREQAASSQATEDLARQIGLGGD